MPDQSTGVCAARTNALVCNINELITELEERIEDEEPFDNPKLTRTAERVFGGSRAQGRYTPRDAYDAVEIAANNYLLERHAKQIMQMHVTEALASVLRPLMQRLPRQTDRTLEQTELQQFSTPPTLAYLAARLLNPQQSDIVLEPSAGIGSLAIWPRAIGAKIICNETSLQRFSLLRCVLNFDTLPIDAEFIDDLLPAEIQPTAVLMNPPFSSTSGRVKSTNPIYGARHVASALRRLREGGRLVAIVSEAMSFHHPSFREWWQRIACLCNIRANLTLAGKEYLNYGGAADVQILVIDKTGATPGANWQKQLRQISWGRATRLEDAWKALKHIVETAPINEPDDGLNDSEPSRFLTVESTSEPASQAVETTRQIKQAEATLRLPSVLLCSAAWHSARGRRSTTSPRLRMRLPMQVISKVNCVEEIAGVVPLRTSTIRCYSYQPLTASALWPKFDYDRELAAQAIGLLMRLDSELRKARANWNDDRFRRIMRSRPRAVRRLIRRWERLDPKPVVPLGSLRRRYHSNLAGHLYDAPR